MAQDAADGEAGVFGIAAVGGIRGVCGEGARLVLQFIHSDSHSHSYAYTYTYTYTYASRMQVGTAAFREALRQMAFVTAHGT